jgi:hypothetical protein
LYETRNVVKATQIAHALTPRPTRENCRTLLINKQKFVHIIRECFTLYATSALLNGRIATRRRVKHGPVRDILFNLQSERIQFQEHILCAHKHVTLMIDYIVYILDRAQFDFGRLRRVVGVIDGQLFYVKIYSLD